MKQCQEVPRGYAAKALPNVIRSAMQCAKCKTYINTKTTTAIVIGVITDKSKAHKKEKGKIDDR